MCIVNAERFVWADVFAITAASKLLARLISLRNAAIFDVLGNSNATSTNYRSECRNPVRFIKNPNVLTILYRIAHNGGFQSSKATPTRGSTKLMRMSLDAQIRRLVCPLDHTGKAWR
jgi:hypothetical protein